jgi:hypothetical protein
MKLISKHRQQQGQSLTEFLFLIPMLLMIVLATVQFLVILDRQQKTQMSTWFALRSQTYNSKYSFYSRSSVQTTIKGNFDSKDEVSVSYSTGVSPAMLNPVMFPQDLKATVTCRLPYSYQNVVMWDQLKGIFANIVQNGKIAVSSDNHMTRNSM